MLIDMKICISSAHNNGGQIISLFLEKNTSFFEKITSVIKNFVII